MSAPIVVLIALALSCSGGAETNAETDQGVVFDDLHQTVAEELERDYGFTKAESECISEDLVATYVDALSGPVDPVDVSQDFLAAVDRVDEACIGDERRNELRSTLAGDDQTPDATAFLAAVPVIDGRMTKDPDRLIGAAKAACSLTAELGLPPDSFELILASDTALSDSLAGELAEDLQVVLDPPELIAFVTVSNASYCPEVHRAGD